MHIFKGERKTELLQCSYFSVYTPVGLYNVHPLYNHRSSSNDATLLNNNRPWKEVILECWDFAWLVNPWWTLAKTLIINVPRKRISCTFHLRTTDCSVVTYINSKLRLHVFIFWGQNSFSSWCLRWKVRLISYVLTFMVTVLAQVHQSCKISQARMTSLHGLLIRHSNWEYLTMAREPVGWH